jgi:hypothetical protein
MTRKMQDILEDASADLKRRGVCPKCLGSGRRLNPKTMRLVDCTCPAGQARRTRKGVRHQ